MSRISIGFGERFHDTFSGCGGEYGEKKENT
jgi:hypothetical protein